MEEKAEERYQRMQRRMNPRVEGEGIGRGRVESAPLLRPVAEEVEVEKGSREEEEDGEEEKVFLAERKRVERRLLSVPSPPSPPLPLMRGERGRCAPPPFE